MANLLILRPETPTLVDGSFTDLARVGTDDPREVATSPGAGAQQLALDFGGNKFIGAIYLGACSAANNWTATGGPNGGSYFDIALGTAVAAPKRTATAPRKYLLTFTPQNLRYIHLAGTPGNGATVGIFRAGEVFQPTWNQEYGAGRSLIDTSSTARNRAGGFGVNPGAIVPTYEWVLGDLTDEETEALFDMLRKVGKSRPMIVAEDPAQTADLDARLHYGLFNRLEKYERRSLGVTRWSLGIEDWI